MSLPPILTSVTRFVCPATAREGALESARRATLAAVFEQDPTTRDALLHMADNYLAQLAPYSEAAR